MGHVTQLANTLQYASEERAEVAEHVTHDPDWQHYLTSSLQPQNTVCNLSCYPKHDSRRCKKCVFSSAPVDAQESESKSVCIC